ncbi:MAG: hypothetical protein ABFD82_10645, partial [Syntrophaceae bacterium]
MSLFKGSPARKVVVRALPRWWEQGCGVQTGNIVYKTNRVHGLHYTARRKSSYAVESDKPNGIKNSAC